MNKHMEKMGISNLLEKQGLEKYTEYVSECISLTEKRKGDIHGGDKKATEAYAEVLENLPSYIIEDSIDMISKEIINDSSWSRVKSGEGAKRLSEKLRLSYDLFSESLTKKETETEMKKVVKKISDRKYHNPSEDCKKTILEYKFKKLKKVKPDGD